MWACLCNKVSLVALAFLDLETLSQSVDQADLRDLPVSTSLPPKNWTIGACFWHQVSGGRGKCVSVNLRSDWSTYWDPFSKAKEKKKEKKKKITQSLAFTSPWLSQLCRVLSSFSYNMATFSQCGHSQLVWLTRGNLFSKQHPEPAFEDSNKIIHYAPKVCI